MRSVSVVTRLARALGEQVVTRRQRRLMALRDAYQRLFASPDGQLVMADLVRHAATEPVMVPGDSHATHFRLGQFDVVQHIRVQGAITDRQILQAVDAARTIDGQAAGAEDDAAEERLA